MIVKLTWRRHPWGDPPADDEVVFINPAIVASVERETRPSLSPGWCVLTLFPLPAPHQQPKQRWVRADLHALVAKLNGIEEP